MHVFVIGWIYIVAMMAIVSDSWVKGIIRFVFLGVIPVGIWAWMSLRKHRARQLTATPEPDENEIASSDASAPETPKPPPNH